MRFYIKQLVADDANKTLDLLEEHGGLVVENANEATHLIADILTKEVHDLSQGLSGRTSTWVKECCRLRTIVWPTKALEWCGWPFQPGPSAGIPFADNTRAVITLTGYTGYQRDALKALITMAGAEFTPALTKSNTHLLCMEPNSKKASAAGHWGVTIVNHLWIMDSVLCWAWQNVEKYQEPGANILAEGSWTRLAVDNPFLSCFNSQHVLAFAMGTHRRLGAECKYVTIPGEMVQRMLYETQVIFPHPRFLSETT